LYGWVDDAVLPTKIVAEKFEGSVMDHQQRDAF
jgi:hypothetical protein